MSDALNAAHKQCPHCGHENRLAAKICTNCGYAFPAAALAQPFGVPLKKCPTCGHENRLSAKVCSQCGHVFHAMLSKGQKWCPECGTVNRLEAKVCTQCGHKFRTDFVNANTNKAPLATHDVLTEPPIMQAPSPALMLPTQYDLPPRLPDPPHIDLPAAPPALSAAQAAPTNVPMSAPIDHSADSEPAPDLSDLDFDTMRRTTPEHHVDSYGRIILSLLKKDRK